MNNIKKIIRRVIKEEKQKLRENYTIQNLESDFWDNEMRIRKNMKIYGFNSYRDIAKIRNYYDLASALGIDSRKLKDVDLQVYSETLADLLSQQ